MLRNTGNGSPGIRITKKEKLWRGSSIYLLCRSMNWAIDKKSLTVSKNHLEVLEEKDGAMLLFSALARFFSASLVTSTI